MSKQYNNWGPFTKSVKKKKPNMHNPLPSLKNIMAVKVSKELSSVEFPEN